ncbi:PAS domain S-box protein [bacterium]|nr:PAS domain S-box protein [bacterium]
MSQTVAALTQTGQFETAWMAHWYTSQPLGSALSGQPPAEVPELPPCLQGSGSCQACSLLRPRANSPTLLPLREQDTCHGALLLQGREILPHELSLLDELAEDLAMALGRMELRRQVLSRDEMRREMEKLERIGAWEVDVATGRGDWTEEVARIHDLEPTAGLEVDAALEFYHPESRPIIEAAVNRAMQGGEGYDLELEIISAKGVRKWVRTLGTPIKENGRVVKLRGLFQDISARKTAQAELRQSRQRAEDIFEHAAIGISECHLETGRYRRVNPKLCETLGYSPEQLQEKSWFEVTHPEHREADQMRRQGLLKGGLKQDTFETRYLRSNGHPVWVRLTISAKLHDDHFITTVEDISEQRETAQLLEEQKQRLTTIFDLLLAGIVIFRVRDGRIVEVNPGMSKMLGWSQAELRGRTVEELDLFVHPEELRQLAETYEQRGRIEPVQCRLRRKSGEQGDFLLTGGPAVLDGEPCAIGLWHDITELRETDAALRESDRRVRTMFQMAPVGICLADPASGRLLDANARYCEITGYTVEELRRLTVADLTHPEDNLRMKGQFSAALGKVGDFHVEKRYLRKDGSIAWVQVDVNILYDEQGQPSCTIAVIEDVTTRKQHEASLKLYQAALEAAANGIIITDRTGAVVQVNAAACKLSAQSPPEMLGRFPFATPQDLQEAMSAGEVWHGEVQRNRPDGSSYHEELTVTPLRSAQGELTHFVGIQQDATERIRVERQLREAEQRSRVALDAVGQGTMRWDLSTATLELDGRAQEHFEMDTARPSFDELLLKIHPEDQELARASAAKAFLDGVEHCELRIISKDQSIRWLAVHGRSLYDGQGQHVSTITTSLDITQAKASERALRASQERYSNLVNHLDDVVFSVDLSGRLLFVNQSVSRLGYQPADLLGRHIARFLHGEDRSGLRAAHLQKEWRILSSHGKVRWFRVNLNLQPDQRTISGVAMDVTAQKATEEQLLAAQKMEAIGRLAGGIAHDFNNLLTVILSYTELVHEELATGDPLRDDLQEVVDAGERAKSLTSQLLAFSRRQMMTLESIDLNELVQSVERMLRRLIGEDIFIQLELLPGICSVKADRGQLEQVLLNLAVNARDAMPDGGRLVLQTSQRSISPERGAALDIKPGEYAELVLRDNGCGMTEEVKARIFEPFFTTKEQGKGTGLGLAMVYGILRQGGGAIEVESQPGAGCCFTLFLPESTQAASEKRPTRSSQPSCSGQENILVVEDEPALLNLAKRTLAASGYNVLTARNGEQALQLAAQSGGELDLILSDVVMPGMSGPKMISRLRPLCPKARFLMMSGYPDDALEGRGIRPQEYLSKPFDAPTLRAAVRSLLDEPWCGST